MNHQKVSDFIIDNILESEFLRLQFILDRYEELCVIDFNVFSALSFFYYEFHSSLTCDRHDVEQPPHGLWADVAEPVLSNQQLGQVEGHLSGDGPLHLPTPVCVLNRK